ncbi:MAG: site-2 protease family protein [Candidatus Omnitrophica bacterium]|nr:site-2 protease family protein [Candidatus Omnitrophota bacterium]
MAIFGFLISFGLLLLAMSVHEFSHAWVSYKFGDPTPKLAGRLSLNPLAHIDIMGTLILPLFLFIATGGRFVFGAAKPVPINYLLLKNPKRDIIWIGLAGPASNLILAFGLSLIIKILPHGSLLSVILNNFSIINIVLGVFNLIPIPPLDGSRVVMGLLPPHLFRSYISIEPYGFIILMALIAFGIFNIIIWPIVNIIIRLWGL